MQHLAEGAVTIMDMSFDEWSELIALEAPSIWGLAVPQADILDVSEPTFFTWESSETESLVSDHCVDSLRGYSPSPDRIPQCAVPPGFNLDLRGVSMDFEEVSTPCEAMAFAALRNGWISEPELMQLVLLLPTSTRAFQHSGHADINKCLFITGAYVRGPMAGVMANTSLLKASTALFAAVIRSAAPDALFSSVSIILNIISDVHRDSHNHPLIPNTLVRLSEFSDGALWIESEGGPVEHQGYRGFALELERPFVQFDPRRRHGTLSWSGDRLVAAAFHVRQPELLSFEDRCSLTNAGFRLVNPVAM